MGAHLVGAHLEHLRRRNLSPGTIEQRRRALARLARHITVPVDVATTDHLLDFISRPARDGRPMKPATVVAELAHLHGFYRWLVLEGHRIDDPTTRLERPKVPRGLPRPISEPDLRRALDAAPDRIRPWYLLAAFAGLRACEVAPLHANDLLWDHQPAQILVRRGKGGHQRYVPMAPVLVDELRRLPRRGWLFLRGDDGRGHVSPWVVSHVANAHLHSLGIWDTFHSLRHRFGTQALRASGGDLRLVQELMGHATPNSTAIYTAVEQELAAAVVAALPLAA